MSVRTRRRRYVINSCNIMHNTMVAHWEAEETKWKVRSRKIRTRYERIVERNKQEKICMADERVKAIKDIFFNGLDVEKWSETQIKIFDAFLFICLPLIYGKEWEENKTRILDEWEKDRAYYYGLVNLARRNGKTWVTSGFAAAMLLSMECKLAIFSTCKRTSQMMMSAVMDRIEGAFKKGTHANRQEFVQIVKNMESVMYEGPDGSKRLLGSFPGSVRVSIFCCVCVCMLYDKNGMAMDWIWIWLQEKNGTRYDSFFF